MYDDYWIPSTWTAKDIVSWVKTTLTEVGVTSVELLVQNATLLARVHRQ